MNKKAVYIFSSWKEGGYWARFPKWAVAIACIAVNLRQIGNIFPAFTREVRTDIEWEEFDE